MISMDQSTHGTDYTSNSWFAKASKEKKNLKPQSLKHLGKNEEENVC